MPRPTVDVQLNFPPNGEWATRALIDTGSPITVFDRGTADALLVRIGHAGAETHSIKLLGGSHTVQFEDVDLCLIGHPSISWTARVGFITDPQFQMPFQGVLGTQGFLDKWAVTFNWYYGWFCVAHPDDET